MSLLTFLSDKEITETNKRILNGESLHEIGRSFPKLNRSQKSVLWDYLRSIRYPSSSGILGSKTEPYQDEDQIGVLPEYTWESLSKEEKDFYNIKNLKNGNTNSNRVGKSKKHT